MNILGMEPLVAAFVVTFIGAVIQLGSGYLASADAFNWKKALSTALTTVVVGIVAVSTTLSSIAEGTADLGVLIVVATVVAAIAGFDGLKNQFINAAQNRKP